MSKLKFGVLMSAITVLASQAVLADEQMEPFNTPYFAMVGRTAYVTGDARYWLDPLDDMMNRWAKNQNDPSKQIDTIVFVNTESVRPERADAGFSYGEKIKKLGISTVIAGRCELFCARMFSFGKTRYFAQDVGKESSNLAIQIPIDYETKKLERRFPNTQMAVFEASLPQFASQNKSLLVQGFSKPADETGGLFIGPETVKYCDSLKSGACQDYAGLNAYNMGLTTSPGRVQITLPSGLSVPVATGFADINDVTAVLIRSGNAEKSAAGYKRFVAESVERGRALAVSEDLSGRWAWASGWNAVERALKRCEVVSKSHCRLYAVDNQIVW